MYDTVLVSKKATLKCLFFEYLEFKSFFDLQQEQKLVHESEMIDV